MTSGWVDLTERGTRGSVALICWIAIHGGRRLARPLLHPITAYFLLTSGQVRKASRQYLRRVLPGRVRWWHCYRHVLYFASTILDRVSLLTGRFEDLDVRIRGEELIERQLESGLGCLLLGSHLGSFEVLRAAGIEKTGDRIRVLMYPEHNKTVTELLHSLNPSVAASVIPIGTPETLLQVRDAIDAGCLVGLLGDRIDNPKRAVVCRFLGENVAFPEGPLRLAIILNVPVVLFFGLYLGGNRYDIHFELLCPALPDSGIERNAVIRELTQAFADRLAYFARNAPYNWFNFYDFWSGQGARP